MTLLQVAPFIVLYHGNTSPVHLMTQSLWRQTIFYRPNTSEKLYFQPLFFNFFITRGTVTFFIQTFFIRDKVYTNFLYTGQSLYRTKFIQDKFYTGTKFIRGQSLYGDKVYTGQSLYDDKVYTRTMFIQTFFILYLN